MSRRRGFGVAALLISLLILPAAAAHAAGSLGVAKWEAGTCNGNEAQVKECEYASPPSAFYTQAAGHPPWGLTGFELSNSGAAPNGSALKRLRVDVPPGLAADPQALAVCSRSDFEENKCAADTKAGFVELKAYVEIPLAPQTLTLEGSVYNLPQEPGLPLVFGIDVEGIPPLVKDVHLLLEGHVSYAHEDSLAARGVPSGDFHEWFEINNIPTEVAVELLGLEVINAPLKTVESKLFFDGHAGKEGKENFLTMPSSCAAPSTSYLELETYPPVEKASLPTTPPVSVDGCENPALPFEPTATIAPETSQHESPDGITTDVHVPQFEKSTQLNTADINDAHVTLPEGLTLNPAAVNGLQACTQSQLHKGSAAPAECPTASKIGTVNIETDLPPGSLAGNVYLGQEDGTPAITGLPHPFLMFIDAESVYDVSVRLEGQVFPNPATGQLEVSFLGNPQLPFSDLTLTLNGGPRAVLANPLSCDPASTSFSFSAYTGASFGGSTPFAVSGCPASTPFALAQTTATSSPNAGAYTQYTFNLARDDGNQYLGKVSTVLPAGLVGEIPKVTLCNEPQAQAGSCSAASQIGVATASVGAGSEPYSFTGPVFLTGPYQGAPYGLSIPIHAAAGPFDLGNVVTHATISVDPHSGRVIVTTTDLPSIFKGVPLRLRNINVAVNRGNFLFNPTNCGPLATNTVLSSTGGATQGLSSPFAVGNCKALPFKPNFSAATSASTDPKTLKANGAALRVNLLQGAHEANIHSVVAELPKTLPSRLTTLQKACPEATYAANPFSCPAGSKVGNATVATPVLPLPLKGPAYLVSHGGAAFPDLDLLLEGDGGVRVILESNTDIKGGVTKSTFASIPDVPVSSFVLELPSGPNSALTAVGALCTQTLTMPTTITAQSGAIVKVATPIAVSGCTGGKGKTRIKILSKKIKNNKLVLRVQTFAAGRVSVKNRNLKTTYKKFAKAGKFTIKAPLSRKGVKGRRAHKLKFKARVGFLPKSKAESVSVAFTSVGFRHKAKKGKRKH
ncbi:MAG TPA: hypothetical protein VHW67_11940 [Solirubrobacteraceae bacterium]|nr:hypothetical protein [Solirubrobacteraceae bacterium]